MCVVLGFFPLLQQNTWGVGGEQYTQSSILRMYNQHDKGSVRGFPGYIIMAKGVMAGVHARQRACMAKKAKELGG